jgi:hypothetical protein
LTFKSVSEMSAEERLILRTHLLERRESLLRWRDRIRDLQSFTPEPDEAYDIAFYGFSGIGMRTGRGVLSRVEARSFTAEMRASGIERHRTFTRLAFAIVNAQLGEVDDELGKLSADAL